MRSLFSVFRSGLQKTKTALVRQVQAIFAEQLRWTPESYAELEAVLLQADLGMATVSQIVEDVRDRYQRGLIQTSDQILEVVARDIQGILETRPARPVRFAAVPPTVILLVGVNGSGKTTTAAKLAHLFQGENRSVMLAACDTFRAAAVEQLRLWGERLHCPVVHSGPGSDAAAVAFDAVTQARQSRSDVLLIDTAGRQHTRKTLMEELPKICRTVAKVCPEAPHEVWLVLDASTGSNAVTQAREFGRTIPLTGLIITKLDGTGKGGSLVAIAREMAIPVLFAGLGEQLTDLQPFNPEYFARAICEPAQG